MEEVYREQGEHGDLFLLHIKEKYEYIVGNFVEMLRQAVDLLDDDICGAHFIAKADSDVFVSYSTLIPVRKPCLLLAPTLV